MAEQLARPDVEVVQEFQSSSPTIVTPTLPACIVAPYFEVLEVLNADGTVNTETQLADAYKQLDLVVGQSSFPSPRGNIDEVNVDEESIRVFLGFGGGLTELSRTHAFHIPLNVADIESEDFNGRPYVVGANADGGSGFTGLDGLKLILNFNSHKSVTPVAADIPASSDVTITFTATTPGGAITIDEVIEQVNAVIPDVASEDTAKLAIHSLRYGVGASVVVRKSGSANAVLGFDITDHEIAIGPGFYAVDDSDGDMTSPRLQIYAGTKQKLLGGTDVPVIGSLPDFIAKYVEIGDTVVADGVDIGEIAQLSSTRLVMQVEQNLMKSSAPFKPRRLWIRANSLSYPAPASSEAATLTATLSTTAATVPYIVGATEPDFTPAISAGQSFTIAWAKEGVAQDDETYIAATDISDLATLVTAINALNTAGDIHFLAYKANKFGDAVAAGTYLGLKLNPDCTGSASIITMSSFTSAMTIGFTAGMSDVGENIRYLAGTPAILVGDSTAQNWTTSGARTSGNTVILVTTVNNVAQDPETIAWSASHAATGPGLIAAIADWNSQSLYTEAYAGTSAGVEETPAGTSHFCLRTRGENLGTTAKIDVTGGTDVTVLPSTLVSGTSNSLEGSKLLWSLDLCSKIYEVIFLPDEDDGGLSLQQVIDKVNEKTPGVASASSDSPPKLVLTSNKVGEGSEVEVHPVADGSTANTFIGFNSLGVTDAGAGRPNPDLAIDIYGDAVIQGHILRDGLTGYPFADVIAPIYIMYTGLRIDLSPDAANPGLITWSDTTTLLETAPPINKDNPGSLMSYLALLNSPRASVLSIGVPEVSADAPDGTPVGYQKCFEFLESEEVYALALATQNSVIHQAGQAHVDAMSQPESKGERILLFNPPIPDRANPSLVGSGTDCNSTEHENEVLVETNIAPGLIALGIDPNEDINPTTGEIVNEVYLDIAGTDLKYLIQKVEDGTKITIRTTFADGDGNDDSFFSTTDFPLTVISDEWSVFKRGAPLLMPGSTKPDKDAIAETVQGVAKAYGDRRLYYVFPDKAVVNVGGLDQQVNGYYAAAAVAGMIGQLPPYQGFTNYPIAGLVTVNGSNDMFKEEQLAVMAAGGVYILVQDVEGAPVVCRHQLSTDISTLEKRELSITKDVDYVAKFMRIALRNWIGRTNITEPFMDQLGTITQGLIQFLIDNHYLNGAEINNILQDENQPDTIIIDITLDVPYPCNYIRVTLII